MNIRKISVKVILLYSFTIAVFLSPLIMVNYASPLSIAIVIVLVGSYVVGELYLWKRKMEEEEKECLHVGLINIALSISFLILAIVCVTFGYKAKGGSLCILFLSIYIFSGVLFTIFYLKQARSNNKKGTRIARVGIGSIAGGMIGIGGAKLFFKDASQSTIIIVLIIIGCFLSLTFLMIALTSFCKFILKRNERLGRK